MYRLLFILSLFAAVPVQASGDTTLTWRSFHRTASCRMRVFEAKSGEVRPHTLILEEIAENKGPAITDDPAYVAELAARQAGFDPVRVNYIFHWGAFSWPGAEGRKDLWLGATFRRTAAGNLGAPTWHVLARERVEELTNGKVHP